MAKFTGALVEKGKTIQEQNDEFNRKQIVDEYEQNMDDYFEFLETGLNLYKKPCINSWSDDREDITIGELIEITKKNINLGFSNEAAVVITRTMIEMIEWINNIAQPALLDQARILDKKISMIESNNELLKSQREEAMETLEIGAKKIDDYDKLELKYQQMLDHFRDLSDILIKLFKGMTRDEIALEYRGNPIMDHLQKEMEGKEEHQPEAIEAEAEESIEESELDDVESDEEQASLPANRDPWINDIGKKKR